MAFDASRVRLCLLLTHTLFLSLCLSRCSRHDAPTVLLPIYIYIYLYIFVYIYNIYIQ